jgi:uncharacterized protein
MSLPWCRIDPSGVLHLALHVQPGAKTTEVAGLHGAALKVRLAAPPVDGKANAALVAFFADMLDVPKGNIELAVGAATRRKVLRITGVSVPALDALRACATQG